MTAVPPVWRLIFTGLVLAALVLLAGSAAQGAGAAKLRVLDPSPVRLAGSGFSPGERVRVRARIGLAKRSQRVRADADGRFRVRFAHLAQDPCSQSLRATAKGSDGHRATLKRVRRLCPPALDPPSPAPPAAPAPKPGPAPDPCLTSGRACPPSL
jgi:hypothetical protein